MAESVVGCPSPQQVRRQAQEVISCHMQGQDELRDRLIREYCSDGSGALLDVTLAFFQSAVHVDHPPTAQHRFHFAITMLGDLIETVAGSLAVTEGELAADLVAAECEPGVGASDEQIVRAAQTALVSHIRVRKGEAPLGVQAGLDAQSLSDLVGGVLLLTIHLCECSRRRVGEDELIRFLLPRVVYILQLGASSSQMTVEKYTHALWMQLVLGDCGPI